MKSSQELGEEFGVSSSIIERVRTILEQGTAEQTEALTHAKGEVDSLSSLFTIIPRRIVTGRDL